MDIDATTNGSFSVPANMIPLLSSHMKEKIQMVPFTVLAKIQMVPFSVLAKLDTLNNLLTSKEDTQTNELSYRPLK